jgi:hypothetical protein
VFDTYGNLASKPLNEETSAINNIIQELEGTYASDVGKVGLTNWVMELKKRNEEVSGLIEERFDESAGRSTVVLKEARAALDESYRGIVERLNALVIIEGEENYEPFIKRWNAVITQYDRA